MVRSTLCKFSLAVSVSVLVMFCSSGTADAANLSKAPNNLGLKGYWSMNEGTGTVTTNFASSTAGAANTGTLTNMESADWVSGKMAKALSFDGVDEYVSIADSSSLDLTTAMTISAWVYLTEAPDATHGAGVVVKGTATDGIAGSYELSLVSDLSVYGRIYTNASVNAQTAANLIPLNTWHHVAVTYNKTSLIVYVDGVSKATTAQTNDLETNNGVLAIGTRPAQLTGAAFPGKIDEVRVYNRALSALDVNTLYKSGTVVTNVLRNMSLVVPTNLVRYYPLDGAGMSGGHAVDRTSGDHAYAVNLSTSTAYSAGRVGQGIYFDNSENPGTSLRFDSTTNTGISGAEARTFAFWAKNQAKSDGTYRDGMALSIGVAAGNGIDNNLFAVGCNSSVWYVYTAGLGDFSTGVNCDNDWHFHIVTYDGTTVRYYLDNVQIGGDFAATYDTTDSPVTIGADFGDSLGRWSGVLNEMRIYDRVLTATERALLNGLGKPSRFRFSQNNKDTNGLVGLWSFDGPDMLAGTTAYDRSGSGYDGSLSVIPATAAIPGKVGQALYFDGTDGEISIPNLDEYATRSVSFWLKRGREPANWFDGIIACSTTGGWGIGIYDYAGAGSKIYDGNIGSTAYLSTAGITDQEWHHVVETRGGGTIKFYIDGALDSSQADSDTYSCAGGTALYAIGNINSTSPKFQGVIDDLRLYNRVLTQDEITVIYNRTK